MSAAVAYTWALESRLPDWIQVPVQPFDRDQWRSDITEVFELVAAIDAEVTEELDHISAGGALDIEQALDTLLEFATALQPGERLVAGLTVPGRWPLPVIIRVSPVGDDSEDLLDAAGARGGLAIELPTVEYLPDEIGDGIRVTRFDLDDAAAIWATVSCARRADGFDTVLTWRTRDLELVPVFSPELESLLSLITIEAVS